MEWPGADEHAGGGPGADDRAAAWRGLAEACGGNLAAADQVIAGLPGGNSQADQPATCLSRLAAAQYAIDRDGLADAARLLGQACLATFPALPGEPDPLLVGEQIAGRLRVADGAIRGTHEAGQTPQAGHRDKPVPNGRILLADGDVAGALAMAEQCLDTPAQLSTLRDRIGALLLAAVAHRRLGAPQSAAGYLEQALMLAEPHRILRMFLDGGTPLRSAISALIRPESGAGVFAARVLQRFAYRASGAPAPVGVAVRLSGSELAVLRFLPSHLTNQEIADALCLSVNTVKTHLRTAYRKLGVTSRRAAIVAGEQAGLL